MSFTDFSEYVVGVQPSNWTEQYSIGSASATVRTGPEGRSYLELSGGGYYAVTWDEIDTYPLRVDTEVLAKVTQTNFDTGVSFGARACLRVSGTPGSSSTYDGYFAYLYGDYNIRIARYVSGGYGLVGSVDLSTLGMDNFTNGRYVWVRFRAIGSSLKMKVWYDGEDEPLAWHIEEVDSSITAGGGVGFSTYDSDTVVHLDSFSVATGGYVARMPDQGSTKVGNIYESLSGFKGTLNDRMHKDLGSRGMTGTLSDRLAQVGGYNSYIKMIA